MGTERRASRLGHGAQLVLAIVAAASRRPEEPDAAGFEVTAGRGSDASDRACPKVHAATAHGLVTQGLLEMRWPIMAPGGRPYFVLTEAGKRAAEEFGPAEIAAQIAARWEAARAANEHAPEAGPNEGPMTVGERTEESLATWGVLWATGELRPASKLEELAQVRRDLAALLARGDEVRAGLEGLAVAAGAACAQAAVEFVARHVEARSLGLLASAHPSKRYEILRAATDDDAARGAAAALVELARAAAPALRLALPLSFRAPPEPSASPATGALATPEEAEALLAGSTGGDWETGAVEGRDLPMADEDDGETGWTLVTADDGNGSVFLKHVPDGVRSLLSRARSLARTVVSQGRAVAGLRADLRLKQERMQAFIDALPRCQGHGNLSGDVGDSPCANAAVVEATWMGGMAKRLVCRACLDAIDASLPGSGRAVPLPWEHALVGQPQPRLRAGQVLFAALEAIDPDFAERIRGGAYDPFHGDARIPACLRSWRAGPEREWSPWPKCEGWHWRSTRKPDGRETQAVCAFARMPGLSLLVSDTDGGVYQLGDLNDYVFTPVLETPPKPTPR